MQQAAERQAALRFWDDRYRRRPASAGEAMRPSCERALAHFGDVRGKALLEIGCGIGRDTLFWAAQGAEVTAIDTSAEAVARTLEITREAGYDNVRAVALNALEIPSLGRFDFVYGAMILHHIEPFDGFADALAESLHPEGKAFFWENSAMSGLLIWCRQHLVGRFGIPKYGDPEEFPLTPQEVDLLRRRLSVEVSHPEFYFVRLVSQYLLRNCLKAQTASVDRLLHRLAPLRRYSYQQDLLITKPR